MTASAEATGFETGLSAPPPIAEVFPDVTFPLDEANLAMTRRGLQNGGDLTPPTVDYALQTPEQRQRGATIRSHVLEMMSGEGDWNDTPGITAAESANREEAFLAVTAHAAAVRGYDLMPLADVGQQTGRHAAATPPLSDRFSGQSDVFIAGSPVFPMTENDQVRAQNALYMALVPPSVLPDHERWSVRDETGEALRYAYDIITGRRAPQPHEDNPQQAENTQRLLLAMTTHAAAQQGYALVPRQPAPPLAPAEAQGAPHA